jgi:hypothetical protein
VTIDALVQQRGVGTALLTATKDVASAQGCSRLWLITTNDNLDALRFYLGVGSGGWRSTPAPPTGRGTRSRVSRWWARSASQFMMSWSWRWTCGKAPRLKLPTNPGTGRPLFALLSVEGGGVGPLPGKRAKLRADAKPPSINAKSLGHFGLKGWTFRRPPSAARTYI